MLRRRGAAGAAAAGVAAGLLVLAGCGAGGLGRLGSPASSTRPATSTTAAGGSGGASSPAASAGSHTLQWRACSGSLSGSGLQCAELAVPVNYADPNGPTIELALDRVRATGKRLGSLLINPGGPGGSGLQFLPEIYPDLTSGLTTHFDIIGFDPRGVADSAPIVCGNAAQLTNWFNVDAAPTTPAGVAALLTADKQFAEGCQHNAGALLGEVGTVDAARDMESIRIALGDPKLNYLGFSYGTFLGATYADLYPTHIRAMVLDGAENPALGAIASVNTQSVAIEDELNQFFAWCAAGNGCKWKPAGGQSAMQPAVLSLLAAATAHPLPTSSSGQAVGPNQVIYGIADTLYTTSSWPDLGTALAQAAAGNGSGLLALYNDYVERGSNGQYQNLLEANSAISCDDTPKPTEASVLAAAPAAAQAAPVFGLANLYSLLQCVVWPVASTDTPHAITAPGSPPIVVVGSTGDPATPYSWAQALAKQLSKGVLLTRDGDGHTGYLFSSCVRQAVNTYMVDLVAPTPGTSCPTGN